MVFCLKVIPLFMFMSMWIHTILLNFGIDLPFAETIMGCALLPSILNTLENDSINIDGSKP